MENHQLFHLSSKHGSLHTEIVGHEFNGQTDFIQLDSSWGGAAWHNCTIEAWINTSANTGDFQAIISPSDHSFIHFQLHTAGNITIYTDAGPVILPVIPLEPLNLWRHVAVIAKSGGSKLIIDGDQVGETNTTEFNNILETHALYIGKGFNHGRFFNGKIGDIKITHDKEHEHIHAHIYKFLDSKPEMKKPEPPTPAPAPTPVSTVFGFKSYHGKFMSAQPNGTIECNRNHLLPWEKFTIVDGENGKVGLKSVHGKYVSAQPDGSLTCDRPWLQGWELFTMEEVDGKVGLKGHHGKYISAQPDGTITCDRDWLQGWELFAKMDAA